MSAESSQEPKLKIEYSNGEVEIIGNREGLHWFAGICEGLSGLTDAEAKTPANHWHFSYDMNTAEEGSAPLTVLLKVDL